ncbi:MAG: hypothetical protein ACREJ2_02990 [Planctomycetota bacterium]
MHSLGRTLQAVGLILMGAGVFWGITRGDMGLEFAATGVALALFMLGLLLCKKAGGPQG